MNWKTHIATLEARGLSRKDIAERASCSISMVNSLATGLRGENISFSIGKAIMDLLDLTADHTNHKKASDDNCLPS